MKKVGGRCCGIFCIIRNMVIVFQRAFITEENRLEREAKCKVQLP